MNKDTPATQQAQLVIHSFLFSQYFVHLYISTHFSVLFIHRFISFSKQSTFQGHGFNLFIFESSAHSMVLDT